MATNVNHKRITNELTYAYVVAKAVIHPSSLKSPYAVADSGATDHFISTKDSSACSYQVPTPFGPKVAAANGKLMKATHSIKAPLSSHLSPTASTGHVLDGLSTGSLISIGKLCDDDCAALF